jgi:two-component system phosphate regulon sensor histidine kinase PhoR
MDNHLNRPEVQAAFEQTSGMSIRFSQTLGVRMLYVALPITDNQQILGIIRIALPVEQLDKSITQIQKVIIIGILIFSALSIVIASIIAERTTRPIRQLTSAVQKLSTEAFDQGLIVPKQDEIGRLTQAFVNVRTQLQNQISSLKAERSKFAAVLDQMNDGVLIVDENSQIQLINPAAELMFNIAAQDVLDQSLAISIRHHKIIELWRNARASSTTQSMTLELSSLSLILQGTAIPLDEPLPGSTLMIFQDLTNIRRLETIR